MAAETTPTSEISAKGTEFSLEPNGTKILTPPFGMVYRLECTTGEGTLHVGDDNVLNAKPGKIVSGITTFCEARAGVNGLGIVVYDVTEQE